ncbi:hypothetical protein [Burkholderia glumae]
MTNNTTAAETLTLHELNLVERLRDANRDIFPSDRNGLIALIERLTSPRAAVPADRRKDFETAMAAIPVEDGNATSFIRNGDDSYVQRHVESAWLGFSLACQMLDAAPAAPVAEYDGNHVQNHCTECNEHEVECSCAQAVAADGAEQDELQGIVEACEELGCPDGMTPRQFISDIWSLLIAWYQASSEGKIAVSDPAYHLVTATAALMGDERAAVSPATAEPTDYAAIEREHFGDPDKRTGIYAQATADGRAAIVEQCAKIADSFTCGSCGMDGKVGAAIRASQAAAPAEAREITMTVEDAMRIVMANWGDKDAIERVFRANVVPADAGEAAAIGFRTRIPGFDWVPWLTDNQETIRKAIADALAIGSEASKLYSGPVQCAQGGKGGEA